MFEKLRTVLVVEDAADQLLLIKLFVERMGLKALTAIDGMSAIKVIESHSIDLLITDYRMPNMDGGQLLKWCRAQMVNVPTIILSSEAHYLRDVDIDSGDCCSVLIKSKPVNFLYLETAIRIADQRNHEKDCHFKSYKQAVEEELARNAVRRCAN